MAHVSNATAVGGWEGLAVAVVIVARQDAIRGDTKAGEWLATVAPYVLGWVFPDMDPIAFADYLRPVPVVVPIRKQKAA